MALGVYLTILVTLSLGFSTEAEIARNDSRTYQPKFYGNLLEFIQKIQNYAKSNDVKLPLISEDALILDTLKLVEKSRPLTRNLYTFAKAYDKENSGDRSIISHSKCHDDMNFLLQQANILQESNPIVNEEMITFFDSYGAVGNGLFKGNLHWIGYYSGCLARRIQIYNRTTGTTDVKFAGRYCVASFKSPLIREPDVKGSESNSNYAESSLRLRVGLCLPDSCDSNMLEHRYDDIKKLLVLIRPSSRFFKLYDLEDVFCEPDEGSKLRKFDLAAWTFLLFSVSWAGIILLTTGLDIGLGISKSRSKSQDNLVGEVRVIDKNHLIWELISCLSILSSLNNLVAKYKEVAKVKAESRKLKKSEAVDRKSAETRNAACSSDLLFLDSLKVMSLPLIIYWFLGYSRNTLSVFPIKMISETHSIWQFLSGSNSFMDCLLVIIGFATAYKLCCNGHLKSNKTINWTYLTFQRYLSLAPVYLLMFWFAKSMIKYTGYGPLWDYGTGGRTVRAVCENQSWLWALTLTSNYHSISDECIIPSWFISAQMQLFLITPFLLILLQKSPIMGWLLSLGLVSMGTLLKLYRFVYDPVAKRSDLMRFSSNDYISRTEWTSVSVNLQGQFKIPAYVIGLLGGHFAYMVMSGKWSSILCPRKDRKSNSYQSSRVLGIATRFCVVFTSCVLFLSNYLIRLFQNNITPLLYPIWVNSLSLGTVLLIIMITFERSAQKDLTSPICSVLNRFSYCMYIIQLEVIYWFVQYYVRLVDYENNDLYKVGITITWLCFIFGSILYFFVEAPIRNIEKKILRQNLNYYFKKQIELP